MKLTKQQLRKLIKEEIYLLLETPERRKNSMETRHALVVAIQNHFGISLGEAELMYRDKFEREHQAVHGPSEPRKS